MIHRIPTVKMLTVVLHNEQRRELWESYTADALWVIASGLGAKVTRYSEVKKQAFARRDTRTGAEILAGLQSGLKKIIEGGGK